MKSRPAVALCALLITASAGPAHAHPGSGIVVTRDGRVLFVTVGDSRILTIGPGGEIRTFLDDPRLRLPHHLVLDPSGDLYSVSDHDGRVRRITPAGGMTQVFPFASTGAAVHLGAGGDPFTVDANGDLHGVDARAEAGRWRVVRVDATGASARLAGSEEGHRDGRGAGARFGELHFASMVIGPDGCSACGASASSSPCCSCSRRARGDRSTSSITSSGPSSRAR